MMSFANFGVYFQLGRTCFHYLSGVGVARPATPTKWQRRALYNAYGCAAIGHASNVGVDAGVFVQLELDSRARCVSGQQTANLTKPMCWRWRLFPAASAHWPSHPVQAESCSEQACLPLALILLARSLAHSLVRWFACPLSLSLSLCGYLALPLSVLLARARSTEHRYAHCRLASVFVSASVSVCVSGIWHNFSAGRGRDKSVNKRHKTAARTDNAAQNRLCSVSTPQPPVGMVTA